MNVMYRVSMVVIGCVVAVYGLNGVIHRHLSSGQGSWAKAPWLLYGDGAVVLGAVFLFLGFYMIYVAVTTK